MLHCRLRHYGLCLMLLPGLVLGHAEEKHQDSGVSIDSTATVKSNQPLPIDVGGPFSLTDHFGNSVTEQTFAGKHMLVFFGYTDCQVMCSISLNRIGSALKILEQAETNLLENLTPVVVTVDPTNDTPAKLKHSLAKYHPALLGLTGTPEKLADIYQAYKQSPSAVDGQLNNKDVVMHTSYFYLMGPEGDLKTFFPPILNAESMANILKKYML